MKPGNSPGTRRAIHRGPVRIAIAAAAAALLVVPASAQAIEFTALSASPGSTQAGANTDFNIHVGFTNSASDDIRNIRIGLPAGQIGDPNATPQCTVAQLNGGACPANTQVGSLGSQVAILGIPLGVPVSGELYNLVPQPGEPARFGVILSPAPPLPVGQIILQSAVELRQTDFGLDTIINDIPNTAAGLVPIDILSMDVTLFGTAPGTGNSFSRNPTSCDLATTTFSATSYTGTTTVTPATGQASYTPTGCDSLSFDPQFSAEITVPDPLDPGGKPELKTVIEQTPVEAGLRDAKVVVPPDLGPDSNQLLPEEVCDPALFQAHTCPASSVVGSATASSPLLSAPLTGPVILVNNPGGVVKVGLDLQGQLSMLLTGQLALDNSTTFTDLPDIPISHFELKFDGGPSGLLTVNRDICRPPLPSFHTEFLAHSGAAKSADTPATLKGCGPDRSPKAKVTLAGAGSEHPRLKLKTSAASGFSPIKTVTVKLPRQLAFNSGAGKSIRATVSGGTRLNSGAVRAKGRRLRVRLPDSGALKLKVKVAGTALRRNGSLPRKVRFPVKVADSEGKVTSLRAKARAKG